MKVNTPNIEDQLRAILHSFTEDQTLDQIDLDKDISEYVREDLKYILVTKLVHMFPEINAEVLHDGLFAPYGSDKLSFGTGRDIKNWVCKKYPHRCKGQKS